MKMAAVHALADPTREDVPDAVIRAAHHVAKEGIAQPPLPPVPQKPFTFSKVKRRRLCVAG